MSDIIIVDEEFKAVVEQIKTEGKETDEAVQKLIDVFTRITEEVAVEGSVAENFKLLLEELSSLKGQFTEIYSEAGTVMADVLYNKENTSVVIGELYGITVTQVVGSIVSKTLIESKGMSSESIKNLEVSAGEVSSLIKEISSTTSAFLNSLASTWEEFEANIYSQWNK